MDKRIEKSRIVQILLISVGIFSSIFIFCNAFKVSVIYLVMLLNFIVATILIVYRKCYGKWIKIILISVYILLNSDYIVLGVKSIVNAIIGEINIYGNMNIMKFVIKKGTALSEIKYSNTIVLSIVTILILMFAEYSIIRQKRSWMYMFLIFAIVGSIFALGNIPNDKALIICLVSVLTYMGSTSVDYKKRKKLRELESDEILLIENNNEKGKDRIRIQTSIIVMFIFSLLLLVSANIMTKEKYNKMLWIYDAKKQLQTDITDISTGKATIFEVVRDLLVREGKTTGGLSGGKLGGVSKLEFTEEPVLDITISKLKGLEENIYLKGYVAGVYEDNRWKIEETREAEEIKLLEKGFDVNKQTSNFYKTILQSVSVKTSNSNLSEKSLIEEVLKYKNISVEINKLAKTLKTDIMPYNIKAREYDEYASIMANKATRAKIYDGDLYERFFVEIQARDNIDNYIEGEKEYRKYVYDHYLQLPKNSCKRVKEIAIKGYKESNNAKSVNRDAGVRVEDIMELEEKIVFVREYLNMHAEYSLNPGKVPRGEDFVENFIENTGKGYCAHFASAGVIMLRALNVPARYVEGYVITANDIQKGVDKDSKKGIVFDKETGKKIDYVTKDKVEFKLNDRSAHAWVEIYVDGYGFIPIEMTPGYENRKANKKVKKKKAKKETEVVTTNKLKEELDRAEKNKAEKEGSEIETFKYKKLINKAVLLFIIILILYVGIIIRENNIRKKRSNNLKKDRYNDKIIALYSEIERIIIWIVRNKKSKNYDKSFESSNIEEIYNNQPEKLDNIFRANFLPITIKEFMKIVYKAKYSDEISTKAETEKIKNLYDEIKKVLYTKSVSDGEKISFVKQWYYRHVKVF